MQKKNNHTRQYLRNLAMYLTLQRCIDFAIIKSNTIFSQVHI